VGLLGQNGIFNSGICIAIAASLVVTLRTTLSAGSVAGGEPA